MISYGIEIKPDTGNIYFTDCFGVLWQLEPTAEPDCPIRIIKISEPLFPPESSRLDVSEREGGNPLHKRT